MKEDSHWKMLKILLPVSAVVGAVSFFLALWVLLGVWWASDQTMHWTEIIGNRWIWILASLLVYGFLWVAKVLLRRLTSVLDVEPGTETKPVPSRSNYLFFLCLVCLLEACKIAGFFHNLADSYPEFIFGIIAHLFVGVVALFLVASLAILGIPARWKILILTAIILAGGVVFDLYILLSGGLSIFRTV